MIVNEQSTTNQKQSLLCPVCGDPMAFQIARGRKSGKPFLMVKCLRDGRHFRGFVGDRDYVQQLLEVLEREQSKYTDVKRHDLIAMEPKENSQATEKEC